MKIMHISSAKSWRGGERQLDFLIDGLNEKGITSYLMCITDSPLHKKCKSKVTEIIEFKKVFFSNIINARQLAAFCKKESIDIVHAHDSHSHSVVWHAYHFQGLKAKSVVHRRLDNPIKTISKSKYNHPSISNIICVSEAVKNALNPSIDDESRLVVVHSGIDTKEKHTIRQSIKKPCTVLYIAAFTKEKGHDKFLEIAKQATGEIGKENIRFVLLGNGPLLESYKAEYSTFSNINFIGFVDDVYPFLAMADIMLHTSMQESLGTSLLDGMQHGLPCIAHDIGGIPEIIKHGENGFLLSLNDEKSVAVNHIKALLNDAANYQRMSKNCIKTAQSFSKENMVEGVLKVYKVNFK